MHKVVTSALYYANGSIHMGHLVEAIQTDIYVRTCRLLKENVIFMCADDTHGTPIEINAQKQGVTPLELIDKFWKEHTRDFADFHIHFDNYYTTNGASNREIVELIYHRVKKNGFIYEKNIELTYCPHCNRFLPDRYVKGNCPKCGSPDQYGDTCEKCNATYKPIDLKDPYCSICGSKPERRTTPHYFFKLSAFTDQLKKYIESRNFQSEITNYLMNWITEGLEDWDISRDAPYFGFKIPDTTDKYFYVWFDAPIGYIGATKDYCDKNSKFWEDYWLKQDSVVIHIIGKDIIYFHFLFWPAILMAAELSLPEHIQVHGFLTVHGERMSKSRGTFVNARDFLDAGGDPEYLRFFYASNLGISVSDLDFSQNEYIATINNMLIGKFGNLINRIVTFLEKSFNGTSSENIDVDFLKQFENEYKTIVDLLHSFEYRKAIETFHRIVDTVNRYFQDNEPWKLLAEDSAKAHYIISTALSAVKDLTIIISPVIPRYSEKIAKILNVTLSLDTISKPLKQHKISRATIIFKKIEDNFTIKTVPDIAKIKIVSGKITEINDHPEADRLYVCSVDLGGETRQIVAGLKKYYAKEELLGKNVCIVANLKPARLKGIESNGMILAVTDTSGTIGVLTHKEKTGITARFSNIEYPESFSTITIQQFSEVEMFSNSEKITYGDSTLFFNETPVAIDKNFKGKVS